MDENVLNSINVRKSTIYDNYKNVPPEIESKIDDIFARIYDFAEKYDDVVEFENDFQPSQLNNEYISIFTDLAYVNDPGTVSFKDSAFNPKNYSAEDVETMLKDEVKQDIRYVLEDKLVELGHETYQERDQAIRDIPVIGDIIQAKRAKDALDNIFGRKKP